MGHGRTPIAKPAERVAKVVIALSLVQAQMLSDI